MRVLVTGATGFVGRWMLADLERAGHDPVAAPGPDRMDVRDLDAVRRVVLGAIPDGVVHLAGVAFARDAAREPGFAMDVNSGGTSNVLNAAASLPKPPAIVISGSSEVYGRPQATDLPLREDAPTKPIQQYGISKLAQEEVALAAARKHGIPLVVTRSFNHTGPGQREEFVAPALARRVLEARNNGKNTVRVGNLDVERDFSDVRDVVRAYRLLLEDLRKGAISEPTVINVGSGAAVSIRSIFESLVAIAGADLEPHVDPELVRIDDPALIVADITKLTATTGWQPSIPLNKTLSDLVASLERT